MAWTAPPAGTGRESPPPPYHGRVPAPALRLAPAALLGGRLLGGLLGGCAGDSAPADSGSSGAVVVHVWEHPGLMPARIEARRVHQVDPSFNELALEGVVMRLPKADGVVYLSAPFANYAQDKATAIRLYGPPGADGPVRFNGIWRGKLFVGRAAEAVSMQHSHAMRFDDVTMVCEGVCQWTASAEVLESRLPFGRTERRMDVPAVVAALAALPQPLNLPE
jgi:hypothetical protein